MEIAPAEKPANEPIDIILENEAKMLEANTAEAEREFGILPDRKEPEQKQQKFSKYLVSEQERLDSEIDYTKRGWHRYWAKRLLPEIDLLPPEVRKCVEKINQKGRKNWVNTAFYEFVSKRIAAKKFELKKRKVMSQLRSDLQRLDENQEVFEDEDRRLVRYDSDTDSLFIEHDDSKQMIGVGDLVGDSMWGVKYKLSDGVPRLTKRKLIKMELLAKARNKIFDIYDDELCKTYNISKGASSVPIELIERKVKELEAEDVNGYISGYLAEKMIVEFLSRIQHNNPALDFKVEKSNALEDSLLKYDFKIFLRRRRGIAIEPEDIGRDEFVKNKRNFGIQFTIEQNPKALRKKYKAIERGIKNLSRYADLLKNKVEDIVLVSVPELHAFINYYRRWLKEGKPSGGPERYMSKEEKLAIFKSVTEGLIELSFEDLDKLKV